MTQYLLSIYQPDGPAPDPEFLEPVMRDVETWNREVRAANAWVFSGGLHPASTSTVLRVKDGDELMTDGPFTEGKEHLGGFTVISAPDLDAALGWARKLAAATTLPIEVRPLFDDADGSCEGS
ncbi:YciI family protein [Pseudonocardia sp. TRM90224]|uniref:YciI family protein n=1 Tax=Pseudonocardia sp. TRM90224 TaxID=2812678 RepID=UPI001E46FC98|nr:YciI family protein [Pseudonocardia sp. TRM90224]